MVAAPPTAEEIELLVDGARFGDLEDVVAALEDGVGVDAVDEHGRTGKGNMHRFPSRGGGCPLRCDCPVFLSLHERAGSLITAIEP